MGEISARELAVPSAEPWRQATSRWRPLADGAVVERKTPGDLAGCIGASRERFERELKRGRYMIVVVEGTLSDVVVAGRRMHHNAVVGTLAAWSLRYCPFVFAGSERIAADFAFRFLAAQVRDTNDWQRQLR